MWERIPIGSYFLFIQGVPTGERERISKLGAREVVGFGGGLLVT